MMIILGVFGLALIAATPPGDDPASYRSSPGSGAGTGGVIEGPVAAGTGSCRQEEPAGIDDQDGATRKEVRINMNAQISKSAREDRAKFKNFSGLVSRLIDSMRTDSLSVDKAGAITGLKLSTAPAESNDYLAVYRSDRFNDLWASMPAGKDKPPAEAPGDGGLLEAIQMRIPGPSSTSKGSILDLNLRDGYSFTVADFDAFFEQTAKPVHPAHPSPSMSNIKQYEYQLKETRIGLTCWKDTGFCRVVVIDSMKRHPPVPATQKQ